MAILCVRLLTEWCQDRPEGCEWVHGAVPRSQAGPPDGHSATAGSRGQSGDQVRNLVRLIYVLHSIIQYSETEINREA